MRRRQDTRRPKDENRISSQLESHVAMQHRRKSHIAQKKEDQSDQITAAEGSPRASLALEKATLSSV